MSKQYYVYSTLTAPNQYVNHEPVKDGEGNNLPQPIGEGITIQGGAGVANKNLVTPRGVVSGPFDEQQLAYLRANKVFQLHEANGFLQIDDKKVDADEVAADMTNRDGSSPMVDADFPDDEDGKSTAPKTAETRSAKRK